MLIVVLQGDGSEKQLAGAVQQPLAKGAWAVTLSVIPLLSAVSVSSACTALSATASFTTCGCSHDSCDLPELSLFWDSAVTLLLMLLSDGAAASAPSDRPS